MTPWRCALALCISCLVVINAYNASNTPPQCRSQPGDALFPTTEQLAQLNATVQGRLIRVVPSAQFCHSLPGGCPDAEWADAVFRDRIPGNMLQVNWEQDYLASPPSLCFRNTTVCGQGNVPLYAVNATAPAHIQAGVRFAQAHDLRVVIKSSGHDYLGRSTAKNALLLWTHYFQDITFHDTLTVGGTDHGSAVTVGSGVPANTLYQAAKARGQIFVGGTAATVATAAGYVQGGGHSRLSPTFGLASDNTLEFQIVVASGDLVTANALTNPDLFWALRGGGAGSWGVIISATFRTFPTFDVVAHTAVLVANSSAAAAHLATLHAQHIFDWDALRAGQTFKVKATPPTFTWTFATTFPRASLAAANASMAPFLAAAAAAQGMHLASVSAEVVNVNDHLTLATDRGGGEMILGSRLIPADVYRTSPASVGAAYQEILDSGGPAVLGLLVAGGQVAQNAAVDSSVNPQWRTAKTNLIVQLRWTDSTPAPAVARLRADLTTTKVPVLAALAGPDAASYSNEADVREPDFRHTFFGAHYARLRAVQRAHDPRALFVVPAGVGSEEWDAAGVCRVA